MMERKVEHEVQYKGERTSVNKFGDGVAWRRGSMLGKGSFGSVYLATLKKLKSRNGYFPPVFAVKSAEVSLSGTIQKEREVLNNVQGCANVLRCYGEEITTGENGEIVFNLLLEYGSGGTLDDEIKKLGGKGLPESDVRRYTRGILRGLNHIHECGYVHCDLKPDNILLVPNSINLKAKIGDFGLAKRSSGSKKRKLDPYLRGTPLYLSPEAVVDGVQEAPSDIWALGCIVLEMLTGKPPWNGEEEKITAENVLETIGDGKDQLPKIPSEISKEGRDFLKVCFVRNYMYRWTAEMLLTHPFVEGLGDDDEIEESDEVLDANEATLSEDEDEDELSCSYFSDDGSLILGDDSFTYWSEEDGEGMVDEVVSTSFAEETSEAKESNGVMRSDSVDAAFSPVIKTSTPVLSELSLNTRHQHPMNFTIHVGV